MRHYTTLVSSNDDEEVRVKDLLCDLILTCGLDEVTKSTGFHPDTDAAEYDFDNETARDDYDQMISEARELTAKLGMDISAEALEQLEWLLYTRHENWKDENDNG